MSFDFQTVVTARFNSVGAVEYVLLAPVLETLPDQLFCGSCDREYTVLSDLAPTDPAREVFIAAAQQIERAAPGLVEETTLS